MHVGKMMIEKSKEVALEAGYIGLDTQGYKGTSQEGKADIIFYWDAK